MSLIGFHRFLIATGILFCLGFAIWELASYRTTGDEWAAVTGIGFGLATPVLIYYLRHLNRFLGISEPGSRPARRIEESFSPNGHRSPKSKSTLEMTEEL
jgi:hypothetical protein